MKKGILMLAFITMTILFSCEIENPLKMTAECMGLQWDCPANYNIIQEGYDLSGQNFLYLKLSKLSKQSSSITVKYRLYYIQPYNGTPTGWTPYYDVPAYYYQQSMNLHWYTVVISSVLTSYRRLVEVSGIIEANDGTTCDIGVFRYGNSAYMNQ